MVITSSFPTLQARHRANVGRRAQHALDASKMRGGSWSSRFCEVPLDLQQHEERFAGEFLVILDAEREVEAGEFRFCNLTFRSAPESAEKIKFYCSARET